MRRAEWLWAAGLLALLSIGYGLVPLPEPRDLGDSFSEDAGGKRAFFLLAAELLEDVDRSFDSLVPSDPDTDVLVLLGPARYPDRAQWQTLHDWVSQGRAIVFAARWQDPAVELQPFGIRVVPERSPFDSPDETGQDDEEPETAEDVPAITNHLVEDGELEWRSSGRIEYSDAGATVELWRGGSPQVVWQPVGDGVIVVAASDYVFSNRSLTRDDNGLLAYRILESASPAGPVLFDESLNRAGAPAVVGILFEHPFRLPALQILLVALLFAWMSSRRFGPPESSELPARRSLVEHASALGSLHYRVGSGPSLVSAYLEYFRRELGVRDPALHPGAAGSEGSPELARAQRAAKSPRLERRSTSEILAALARARHRLRARTSPEATKKESV